MRDVPKQGPTGVEMLIHEKGAFLTVEEEAPFWMFWKTTRRCTVSLERWGLIWLYQTCAKVIRRGTGLNAGISDPEELQWDLQSALSASQANIANRVAMNDEVLKQVAEMLCQKGWVKA